MKLIVKQVKNLLLVHVYELEALVFADLETFNREYGTEIKHANKKVSEIESPKEKLIQHTRPEKKYQTSHCPELFSKMNIETVIQNCPYFKKFTEEKLERAFTELLGQEGFPHHLGITITRKPDEVLIEEDLQNFLLTFCVSNK
jgi:hypothetical protein